MISGLTVEGPQDRALCHPGVWLRSSDGLVVLMPVSERSAVGVWKPKPPCRQGVMPPVRPGFQKIHKLVPWVPQETVPWPIALILFVRKTVLAGGCCVMGLVSSPSTGAMTVQNVLLGRSCRELWGLFSHRGTRGVLSLICPTSANSDLLRVSYVCLDLQII